MKPERKAFFYTLTTLLCILLTLQTGVSAMHNEQNWTFRVFLNDTPIGFHHFNLQHKNDQQHLFSKARFNVEIFFITVYSYEHENTEIWSNQCLQKLSSKTNSNGEKKFVNLHKYNNTIIVENTQGQQSYNHCIKSFAYWDPELLKSGQALNSQTGELVDVKFNHIGSEKINLNNKTLDSEHYRLLGKNIEIDLWYSKNNNWLALKSKTQDGNNIFYQLQAERRQ